MVLNPSGSTKADVCSRSTKRLILSSILGQYLGPFLYSSTEHGAFIKTSFQHIVHILILGINQLFCLSAAILLVGR